MDLSQRLTYYRDQATAHRLTSPLQISLTATAMGFLPHPSDPFYDLMKPPEDETPAQKTARLTREADAQYINNAIEDQIKEDRAKMKREKEVIKVLLLGQSESGGYLTWFFKL